MMSKHIDADEVLEQIRKKLGIKSLDYLLEAERQIVDAIQSAPSIDIVRCQDCKYWVYNFNGCSRNPCTEPWYATDFCSYGEREGE